MTLENYLKLKVKWFPLLNYHWLPWLSVWYSFSNKTLQILIFGLFQGTSLTIAACLRAPWVLFSVFSLHTKNKTRKPCCRKEIARCRQARFYVGAGGTCPPRFTCCPLPQIQKLYIADHSDVISEVPKMLQNPNFPGLCPGPRCGGLTTLPQTSYLMGQELAAPCQELHPRCRPFGPCVYGSQGATLYRVGNPTNDRFQMYAYRVCQNSDTHINYVNIMPYKVKNTFYTVWTISTFTTTDS